MWRLGRGTASPATGLGPPRTSPRQLRVRLYCRLPMRNGLGAGRCRWPRRHDRRYRRSVPGGRRARCCGPERPSQFDHATARSEWQATLCAVAECCRLATEGAFGQMPILVDERWAPTVAGLATEDVGSTSLARHVQDLLVKCRARRKVWLTACRHGRGQWWADRAMAIRQCSSATWGQPASMWQQMPSLAALRGANDECPICLDAFVDPLPRPQQPLARAPECFHTCGHHAACIGCDRHNNDARCCICRAARQPWVQLPETWRDLALVFPA